LALSGVSVIVHRPTVGELFDRIFAGVFTTLLITGILSFKYYRKSGILTTKELLKTFMKFSIIFGLVFAFGMQYYVIQEDILEDPDITFEPAVLIVMFIGLFIGGIIASFSALIVMMLLGFGAVGVMVAVARGVTPEILLEITRISEKTSEDFKKKDASTYWKYYGLQWFFNIPYVLDTNMLKLNKYRTLKKLPWREIRSAVYFQILFGTIIVIYISFNPLLLETDIDVFTLLNIAFNVTLLIPFLILPWFIYYRLGARIRGPIRSYLLYHGIKHRMFRTVIALGTLLLIIRLALREVELKALAANFLLQYFIFIITVLTFTIVYFNYFENDLAGDITKRFGELRK
jgi:hypothetical protein